MIEVKIEQYNNHRIATYHHDAGSKKIVIFCHGFRGTAVGPSRFFLRASKKLEEAGVSSVRFDQYGSGNSEGDFFDSSFNDWVATAKAITADYLEKGYEVALFGQSMGGSTVIATGSEFSELKALVAWVPDPNVEGFENPEAGYMEEGGQRVKASYWKEAHGATIAQRLTELKAPALIVQCTNDEYINEINRKAIIDSAQPKHEVLNYEGYKHSGWSYDQAEEIISKSVDFVIESFRG